MSNNERPSLIAELARLPARAGLHATRSQRSIWIHGRSVDDFEAATELIRDLRRETPSSYLLFTTPEARVSAWLRARHPGHAVVPPPWSLGIAMDRFFTQLDPVMLVWLGFDDSLPLALVRAARERGLPVVVADGRVPASARFARRAVPLVDRFCVRASEVAERLHTLGAADVVVTGELRREERDSSGRLPTFHRLKPLLARVPGGAPRDFHGRRRTRQLARTRVGRWIVSTRSRRRIPDWASLRLRLGSPDTILCLGNGPSSEDPAVLEVEHDCLMRVNHRWLARGILTRPDMVFVGNLRTTLEVSGCVFGFRVVLKEEEILLRHLLFGLRLDQIEYFTIERVPSLLDDRVWPANPTNGAIMVATAVMLQPRRIVIAGIDLFRDPRGSYPDESLAENDYLPGHERDVDVEVIGHALARFAGEVVVLSPSLEQALRTRCPAALPSSGS